MMAAVPDTTKEADNVTQQIYRKYADAYPALSQLFVEVLANQGGPDWLERGVTSHVTHSDAPGLQATAADLKRAMTDASIEPDEIADLTNYRLESRAEMLAFLQTLATLLAKAARS